MFTYAWKGFVRRGTKSLLTVTGVALAVGLFVGVVSISRSVHNAVASSLSAVGADIVVQKRVDPCEYAEVKLPPYLGAIDAGVVGQLQSTPGVVEVTGVLELWAFHKNHPAMVAGIDPNVRSIGPARIEAREGESDKECCALVAGRYFVPNDDYYCLVTVPYAEAHGLELGQKIFIGPDRRFEICGVVDLAGAARIAGAEVFIPLPMAQRLFDQGEIVTTVFVAVENARAARAAQERAAELIGPEVSFTTEANVDQGTAALASVTRRSMLAISILVLLFTVAMLVRSGIEAVMERVTEVGLMKALGWRDAEVGRLFMFEAVYSGIFGGVIGCLLGWLIAWGYSSRAQLRLPDALSSYAMCATTEPPLELPVSTAPIAGIFITGMLAALLIGTLSGFVASRRASKLDPVVALRRI